MFIQNVAYADITSGNHADAGDRGVLIQIVDPGMDFPAPKVSFEKTFQFKFLDIEDTTVDIAEFSIKEDQAKQIVEILKMALEERRNVIVHCFAGICRSGAVVEVGTIMGFIDPEIYRQPNILVKRLMMKELGLTYE